MSVTVTLNLNGVRVPVELDAEALAAIAAAVTPATVEPPSPYLTVPEAAEHLRCSRQRVDDLLSSGRLTRVKEGRRTLVRRVEVEAHLDAAR